jgi:DNA-binding IclR family transcriptional regulator
MNNTLVRAISILDFLTDNPNAGVTEISNRLELPKSTVHNILNTLNHYGLLEKSTESARYHLGAKLVELGYRAQNEIDICRIAHPYLRGLNEDLDETIHLTMLDQDQVLYVDCIESKKRLRTYSVIGVRAPLYCTSVGKAIMAYFDSQTIRRIIQEKGLPKITEHTITDPGNMMLELDKIRRLGYAVDNMEHEEDLRCVGAPIFNNRNEAFSSISISGPASRVTLEKVDQIAPLVMRAAKEISIKMGSRK